ncbi:hypothetical protein BU16DRAFT_558551 [Lophium mytilinum]|uniref:DUF6594 domain-containing protein n=1 Tax=Lophium mytilinum TaxID=390894 RepID=A0A6A6R1B3_9PEZI|nr:hypothetical protein BU16DRAFT_558551 [Lophium mytilinum]
MSRTPLLLQNAPPGYPRLAAFISMDKEHAIFRKFQMLNCRNLIYLQSEVTSLETQLLRVDETLEKSSVDDLRSWPAFGSDPERLRLVERISNALEKYNNALIQYQQVLHMQSPTPSSISGLQRWLQETDPIIDNASDYLEKRIPEGDIKHRKVYPETMDLVSLDQNVDSKLGKVLRSSLLKFLIFRDIIYLKDGKNFIIFFPGKKVDKIVAAIAVFFAVILTVAAVVALSYEKRAPVRLGLIGMFTFLVASMMALSGARKSEVMMGTIGYVAILVVFVSSSKD